MNPSEAKENIFFTSLTNERERRRELFQPEILHRSVWKFSFPPAQLMFSLWSKKVTLPRAFSGVCIFLSVKLRLKEIAPSIVCVCEVYLLKLCGVFTESARRISNEQTKFSLISESFMLRLDNPRIETQKEKRQKNLIWWRSSEKGAENFSISFAWMKISRSLDNKRMSRGFQILFLCRNANDSVIIF